MPESVELAIVGAGPAGLAAAVEASRLGMDVVLIDRLSQPGGQYYRQPPTRFHRQRWPLATGGESLLAELAASGARQLMNTLVWAVEQHADGFLLALYGPAHAPRRLLARQVILAPGAQDRVIPFPGWTLPGVMTSGAALVMIKNQGVLPGRRVLLAGTGPLQWVLAKHLIHGGAEVVAVLDANPFPWQGWRQLGKFAGQGERLHEGWQCWRALFGAGQPVRWRHTIHAADGTTAVESAVIGSTDGRHQREIAVDTVCLGYGFAPAAQLARQIGCQHTFGQSQGTYVPVRDETLQTTLPGLYVAGDGAGVNGKDVAIWEGRLAALEAVRRSGLAPDPQRLALINLNLARQRRFAGVLDRLFPFPAHLVAGITDDTLVCRCEEITAGEVRRRVAEGATTASAAKSLTRAGMGRCQGRNCESTLMQLIAAETGRPCQDVGSYTVRPPVLPVPMAGLLE